jgi:hypothetical protein
VSGGWLARRLTPTRRSLIVLSGIEVALVVAAVAAPGFASFLVPVALAAGVVATLEVLLQAAFIASRPEADPGIPSAAFQASENAASLLQSVRTTGPSTAGVALPFRPTAAGAAR